MEQDSALWNALYRLFKSANEAMPASAKRMEISRTDMAIIEMAMNGPVSPGELAHHLKVTPAAISIALNRLEERGHLVRQVDPEDARRVLVQITNHAQREVAGELSLMFSEIHGVVERVPAEHRAGVTRFLDEVATVLQRHADRE